VFSHLNSYEQQPAGDARRFGGRDDVGVMHDALAWRAAEDQQQPVHSHKHRMRLSEAE
jgi:hypothetical protein